MKNYLFLILLFLIPALLHAQPGKIDISIHPAKAVYGTPFAMIISGLGPGEKAILKANAIDGSGIMWESTTTLRADNKGFIDMSITTPLSGNYDEPDVMGPLWSMKPINSSNKERVYRAYAHGLDVRYKLLDSQGDSATAFLKRPYQNPEGGLVRVMLDANGCKGILYYPDTGGSFPGIILLSGSGGGFQHAWPRPWLLTDLQFCLQHISGIPGFLDICKRYHLNISRGLLNG